MLTDREKATFEFICKYFARQGCAPKLREIAAGIGIRSKGVVHRHLRAIAAEGLIQLIPGQHRGIRLTGDDSQNLASGLTLPLFGKIAAGRPIEAIPDQNMLDLADFLLGPNRYVLKVQGDSMMEAGILDGDMVIAEQAGIAEDGDIVVALINSDEVTLKRFRNNKDGTITLLPANQAMQPMSYPVDNVQIQGVVVGQVRSYRTAKLKRGIDR